MERTMYLSYNLKEARKLRRKANILSVASLFAFIVCAALVYCGNRQCLTVGCTATEAIMYFGFAISYLVMGVTVFLIGAQANKEASKIEADVL